MGKNNTQTYEYAKSFLGKGGATFRKYCGLPSGAAWCDAFVTYIFHKTDNASLFCGGKKQTYCPTTIKLLRKEMAEIPLYLAMPMDVIFFDWDRNGVPNHIGFVRAHNTCDSIYTIEGNTSNKVMLKTRPRKYVCGVFRPHFAHTFNDKVLAVDGDFQYQSIGGLQKLVGAKTDTILGLNTVKKTQTYFGAKPDGAWGTATSKKIQSRLAKEGYYTGKIDGEFGEKSVVGLQRFINAKVYPSAKKPSASSSTVTKPTTATSSNADKLVAKMKELAWAYGTAKSKYEYKTGAPTSACSAAMKKYGYSTKSKMSDCGNFVNTVVRSSGVDTSFTSLHAVKTPFPKSEAKFNIVHSGKAIPSGLLKAGDIIRYKKTSGGQHAMFYFGDGKVCDAGLHNRFGNIRKDEKRYAGSKVKKSTIQVLRVKN